MFLNLPILNHENLVTFLEIFNLVGGNNHCLAFAELLQAVLEYLFGNLCVNAGQGTVKQVYVCLRVQSPCQRNPCLFALRQGHSFLPNHCEISFRKFLEIIEETGRLDDFDVKILVKLLPKGDIVTNAF